MRIPESLSATVYMMRRPWPWTLAVWVLAFAGMLLMMGKGCDVVAFGACGALLLCGALPLLKSGDNRAHNVLGVTAAALSQVWTLTAGLSVWVLLTAWPTWALVCVVSMRASRVWCLLAELLCVAMVAWCVIF